jgi:hypothetical protein
LTQSLNLDVATQESNQPSLVNSAGRKFEDHLRRRFLNAFIAAPSL